MYPLSAGIWLINVDTPSIQVFSKSRYKFSLINIQKNIETSIIKRQNQLCNYFMVIFFVPQIGLIKEIKKLMDSSLMDSSRI